MSIKIPSWGKAWIERAGVHSQWPVPEKQDERLVFALLEGIGYQCWKYKDAPQNVTEKQAKAWLIKNSEGISKMSQAIVPDYISMITGHYDFLLKVKSK